MFKFVADSTQPTVENTQEYRVDGLNLFKLGAGGVGFVIMTIMLASQRLGDMAPLVFLIGVVPAIVFFTLLYLRWNERIEVDAQGLRRVHPYAGFELPWAELDVVNARKDSLGPYEVYLVRKGGRVHTLKRIYADWDDLIEAITNQ